MLNTPMTDLEQIERDSEAKEQENLVQPGRSPSSVRRSVDVPYTSI